MATGNAVIAMVKTSRFQLRLPVLIFVATMR
jgi:hypothetical protein